MRIFLMQVVNWTYVIYKRHKPFCLLSSPLSCPHDNRELCLSFSNISIRQVCMATDVATPAIPSQNERLKVFLHALLFVAGFSLVFIVGWGGSVTLAGQFFGAYKRIIAQIGGILVIMFGLATLEIIQLPGFNADTRARFTGRTGT